MTHPIAATLDSLITGPEISHQNLTMIPLLARAAEQPSIDYVVLDEALADGHMEITEVSEAGSVPELRAVNGGVKPVFILDGEELLGAKQNRVVNVSLLVAAKAEMAIPVSCVEAGRWKARSRAFTSAPRAQYASGRARRMAAVTCSLRDIGAPMSDQADVWADIAEKSARLQAPSATSAMAEIFNGHAELIDSFVAAMQPVEHQVGALFAIDGRIVALDVFDRPSTLRTLLPKLVRSVAIDAIDSAVSGGKASVYPLESAGPQFLAAVSALHAHVSPSAGMGSDLRLTGNGLTGAALVVDGRVLQLGAFAV
jgi:hypothetical protein